MFKKYQVQAALILIFLSLFCTADNVADGDRAPTGLLQLEPGFIDADVGVEVVTVEFDSLQGLTIITLTLPMRQENVGNLFIKTDKDLLLPQFKPYEKLSIEGNDDKIGVIIYVGKRLKLPIRLYFDSAGQ
ncbi:hypothetical protein [Dasania marina]|uniref:hypothetical protein n=1 Tax=Dasania marina TaxID=471499 RepID=UPI0004B8DFEC|nr:hypothetical protein [Dasania marina]